MLLADLLDAVVSRWGCLRFRFGTVAVSQPFQALAEVVDGTRLQQKSIAVRAFSGSQPAVPDASTELFALVGNLDDGADISFEEIGPRASCVGAISGEGIEEALQEETPLQESDLGGNEQALGRLLGFLQVGEEFGDTRVGALDFLTDIPKLFESPLVNVPEGFELR